MSPINAFFDKVICINMARRDDRWKDCIIQCQKHDLVITRFEGIDMPGWGNDGCTASHAAVMKMIVENEWPRTLVLEDDFHFRFDDSQTQFSQMIPEVPADWFMLYLGGHYAERPARRVSAHVIKMNHMKTTSSYGVTLEAARQLAPATAVGGSTPIDEVYRQFHMNQACYIFQPRLIVQRGGFSDLECKVTLNEGCMTDGAHEAMV